jgi:hypothetical protein
MYTDNIISLFISISLLPQERRSVSTLSNSSGKAAVKTLGSFSPGKTIFKR